MRAILRLLDDFKILLTSVHLTNMVVIRSDDENRIGTSIPHFGPQATTTCISSAKRRMRCALIVLYPKESRLRHNPKQCQGCVPRPKGHCVCTTCCSIADSCPGLHCFFTIFTGGHHTGLCNAGSSDLILIIPSLSPGHIGSAACSLSTSQTRVQCVK